MKERFYIWLAWRLPKELVKWATIRAFSSASVVLSDRNPLSLTYNDVMNSWEKLY